MCRSCMSVCLLELIEANGRNFNEIFLRNCVKANKQFGSDKLRSYKIGKNMYPTYYLHCREARQKGSLYFRCYNDNESMYTGHDNSISVINLSNQLWLMKQIDALCNGGSGKNILDPRCLMIPSFPTYLSNQSRYGNRVASSVDSEFLTRLLGLTWVRSNIYWAAAFIAKLQDTAVRNWSEIAGFLERSGLPLSIMWFEHEGCDT